MRPDVRELEYYFEYFLIHQLIIVLGSEPVEMLDFVNVLLV